MEFLQPRMDLAAAMQPMLNVGATMDIPTGKYLYGMHGEAILTGGCPSTVGVVGMPNAYKTALMRYIILTILARFFCSSGHTYDTESTDTAQRYLELSEFIEGLEDQDIIELNRWFVTNRSVMTADQWFDLLKDFLTEKIKSEKGKKLFETPFMDRDKKSFFKTMRPTLNMLDSISEFTTASDMKMQEENSLGEKGGLTIFMRQGLNKTRFMQEMPPLAVAANHFMLISAHLGKEIPMDPHAPPAKTLQYLKQGMKIKGAPPKFEYLTHLSWFANAAPPLITKDKQPEYPRDSGDNLVGDTDLVCATMIILRNKTGPSGLQTQLIFSQEEGLQPSLTEFHYIKNHERFGIGGNDRNYFLDILPDVNLSRTTVRGKLATNSVLRRAMNITSEICQMQNHWHSLTELYCPMSVLYEDLKAMGYDWDVLLKTRGWWTFREYDDKLLPFLSSLDLLRMRAGKYIPYWFTAEQKAKINPNATAEALQVAKEAVSEVLDTIQVGTKKALKKLVLNEEGLAVD